MKNAFVALLGALLLLAGCSKTAQYTSDLSGKWYTYKLTYNSIEASQVYADTFQYDTLTFTSGGQYTEYSLLRGPGSSAVDTFHGMGTWQFANSNGQLVMTDTAGAKKTYTILNLTGNSVELLRNGYDRYMRKVQ
jgi:Lipocalin-like domain